MAGLLSQQNDDTNGQSDNEMSPKDAQDAMESAPGPTPPEADASGKPTDEEQQQFTQFMDNAFKLIYSDQVFPQIQKSLQGNGNPVDGLASAATMVLLRLFQSIQSSGTKISGAVIWHGGEGVVNELANLAEKLKIHTFNDKELKQAKLQVLDNFRNMDGPRGAAPEGGPSAPGGGAGPGSPAASPGGAGLLNGNTSQGVPG